MEILCFGDSNTWGYSPYSKQRYPKDVRWTGVLQQALEAGYVVLEEGLNGRTTVWDDPMEPSHKNGRDYLIPCLQSHRPLDLVVIMLGTNDLKHRFGLSAWDIANAAGVLIDTVAASAAGPDTQAPQMLLIAPPPLTKLTDFAAMFEGGAEKSVLFGEAYARVAHEKGCHFLDAGQVMKTSDSDGVHFDPDQHRALGLAVAERVREIFR